MKPRTRARSIALQALYEIDLASHLPGTVLDERLAEADLTPELSEFARSLLFGVLPLRDKLDAVLARYAPEWPLDQVAAIDRNILRLAAWEAAVQKETPIKVVINEAVELSKLYGSDSTSRFVNGVLGAIADHQREISTELAAGAIAKQQIQ